MNKTLIALTVLAAAGAATPAAAADSVGARAASAVGHWIAMQGNEALREIREEIDERLADSLKPMLPAPDAEAADAPAPAPAAAAQL